MLSPKATSHIFYVIYGSGKLISDNICWNEGDIFTCPGGKIILQATEDSALYSINDNPLLQYLGVVPDEKLFGTTLYSKSELEENMKLLTDPTADKNREGILLGNATTRDSTKTITPTLWALYNKLPKKSFQKPHRHNSVAIDYCISSSQNVYTLIGKSLNPDGTIKNPEKVYWKTRSVFTTPPGLWHSHHNESDHDAFVLPLQDAGLYTYQRTLDIQFQE
jgi:gentisate 1,2-dioxygenase